jgi:hypothetical protein
MKKLICFLSIAGLCLHIFAGEAVSAASAGKNRTLLPEFLWSGSWESNGNLIDRIEFKLTAPKPHLSLRLQILDKRPAPFREVPNGSFGGDTEKAITRSGAGIYHTTTGSRVLYGIMDSYGLAARVRNVWVRGAPYVEAHAPSSADLKTAPASTAVPQGYAYLGSPYLSLGPGKFRGFASLSLSADEERIPVLSAGTEYHLDNKGGLIRLEGLYTERSLPARSSSTWFSDKPALPQRDTRLFAGTLAYTMPSFGLAADLAYSETFAFGRDYYGNLGLRLGDKPWRLSLALDGAGSRFVDAAGGVPGAGFRTALRLERRGRLSSLLRLSALVRGPGPDQGLREALGAGDFASIAGSFNRTNLDFYYRLPSSSAPLALSRFSLSLGRDGREREEVLDSAGILGAFKLGPFNTVSEAKITGVTRNKGNHEWESSRFSQTLSWTLRPPLKSSGSSKFSIGCSLKAAYERKAGRDGLWDVSASASVRGKRNRLSFKFSSPDFPQKWDYTVSWRMQF